jgi:hypothetical protein
LKFLKAFERAYFERVAKSMCFGSQPKERMYLNNTGSDSSNCSSSLIGASKRLDHGSIGSSPLANLPITDSFLAFSIPLIILPALLIA